LEGRFQATYFASNKKWVSWKGDHDLPWTLVTMPKSLGIGAFRVEHSLGPGAFRVRYSLVGQVGKKDFRRKLN
jgi:hypothetical protein